MGASSTFRQLSKIFGHLESSGAEIERTAVDQTLSKSDGEVTADLSIRVPILIDDTDSVVSMTATDCEIRDGHVSVDLEVVVSGGDETVTGTGSVGLNGPNRNYSGTGGVPAYKNREALQAVYNQCETFSEMTETLGVDVTSETVRRHMIKYGIHDPNGTAPQPYTDADTAESEEGESDVDGTPNQNVSRTSTEPQNERNDSQSSKDESTDSSESTVTSPKQQSAKQQTAADRGKAVSVSTTTTGSQSSATSLREIVSEASSRQSSSFSVSTSDIPEAVTVTEFTDAVNDSRTVHEVTQKINIDPDIARQCLQEFGLIELVTSTIGAEQVTLSTSEVIRRINDMPN